MVIYVTFKVVVKEQPPLFRMRCALSSLASSTGPRALSRSCCMLAFTQTPDVL